MGREGWERSEIMRCSDVSRKNSDWCDGGRVNVGRKIL